MRKLVNGKYAEMTPEEEAEIRRLQEEAAQTPPTPTDAERIAQLEEELMKLKGAM